jgi:chromosome segregation ATPase
VSNAATETRDLAHWRALAIQAGERLQIAETQLKDLRVAADEARARMTKYKGRLDSASERINELQSKLITVSAERDAANDRLADVDNTIAQRVARQEVVKKLVHEYRQSLLDGPIWEVFAEFCREVDATAPADGVKAS